MCIINVHKLKQKILDAHKNKEPRPNKNLFLEGKVTVRIGDEYEHEELYTVFPDNCTFLPEYLGGGIAKTFFNVDYPYRVINQFGKISGSCIAKGRIIEFCELNEIYIPELRYYSYNCDDDVSFDGKLLDNFYSSEIGSVIGVRNPSTKYPTKSTFIKKNEDEIEIKYSK